MMMRILFVISAFNSRRYTNPASESNQNKQMSVASLLGLTEVVPLLGDGPLPGGQG
jgi:hypothetical protein